MLGFNPYFALAGVLALAAAGAGGFVKGQDYAKTKADQAELKQVVQAIKDFDKKQAQMNVVDDKGQQREVIRQETVREITREIPKIIERDKVVYARTCIDGDGVRLIDQALAAALAASNDPVSSAGKTGQGSASPAHN
jgi:hypothetical protein